MADSSTEAHDSTQGAHRSTIGDQPISERDRTLNQAVLSSARRKNNLKSFKISDLLPMIVKRILYAPLAGIFRYLFERYGHLNFLQIAIRHAVAALEATPIGHSAVPHYQQRLAISYRDRFHRLGVLMDLQLALLLQRAALAALPPDHHDIWWHQQNLDVSLTARFLRIGDLSDLESVISLERHVVELLPTGHRHAAWWMHNLARSYHLRYRKLGDIEDLHCEIRWSQAALDATQPGDKASLAARQHMMAVSCLDKYDKSGSLEDLESSLTWNLAAVASTLSGDSGLALRKQSLSTSYARRYNVLHKLEDLEMALEASEDTINLLLPGHPNLPECQYNLAGYYVKRYRRLGGLKDIESAIKWSKLALDIIPSGHPDIGLYQQQLALAYTERYHRLGNIQDHEAALKLNQMSISSGSNVPTAQQNLAVAYNDRYYKFGNIEDLEMALKWAQAAVDAISLNDSALSEQQYILSLLYRERYVRLKNLEDLEISLNLKQIVIATTPSNHPDLAARLASLAISYSDKYNRLGGWNNHDETIKWAQAAVDATLPGNPDLASYQQILAVEYCNKYNRIRNLDDLESGIKWSQAAVDNTPDDHPMLARRQQISALAYAHKADFLREHEDKQKALDLFKNSVINFNPNSETLWQSACKWGEFANTHNQLECLDAYKYAFKALPELLWIGSSISTRHEALVRHKVALITAQAVSACIKYEKYQLAVEFLEQGLAITFQQLLDLRNDDAALQKAHPQIASRLKDISTKLQKTVITRRADPMTVGQDEYDEQRKAAMQRDDLLKEIRTLSGFENFLLPIPFERLCNVSSQGPIIMISCNDSRCDTLILINPEKPILHLRLFGVNNSIASKQLEKLRNALTSYGIHTRQADNNRFGRPMVNRKALDNKEVFEDILSWLWKMVVSPIFEVLYTNNIKDGRLWWCPTGPFTYLPLHAAGPSHDFIQSYTSTLGALLYAHKKANSKEDATVTAVGLSQLGPSSKVSSLPDVMSELNAIKSVIGDHRTLMIHDHHATLDRIVYQLSSSTWLHLACHGQQDPKDPLKSGLLLYDKKLELGMIMNEPLPNAEFVFLSACETAMGDSNMTNESLHLAGGMLFAGFKAAIGTMWSINDKDGPPVAEAVYRHLFAGKDQPDVKETARALHIAVENLRKEGVPPHRWVPFIHIGI